MEFDIEGERTEVPNLVGQHRPDLILINDLDLAYAKIRLDEDSVRTAIAHLADVADPLARSLVWGSLWDSTGDLKHRDPDPARPVAHHRGVLHRPRAAPGDT